MFKARRNFKCNGIKKEAGQEISKEEISKFDNQFDFLIQSGLIERAEDPKKEKSVEEIKEPEHKKEEKPVKKVSKKHGKKEAK